MWRIGTFVDQWLLSGRSIRLVSKRRPPRRAPIGKRPELEAVEARILLSAADVAMIRATPFEVHRLAKSSVQITEVHGVMIGNRRAVLMATLTSNGGPLVGQTVAFRLGDRIVGRAKTDSHGVATLTNVQFGRLKFNNSLANTVVAVFRGNANLRPAVRRGALTIGQATSTLADVTGTGVYGGTATFSTTLSSNGAAVSGKVVSFVLDGRTVGAATTDAKGVATLSGVGLAGLDAGTYGITARFAGDADSPQAIASGSLTIAKAAASITLGGLSRTYQGAGEVTATTLPAGLPISLSYTDASGNAVARPVGVGAYTVTATITDKNYSGTAVGTLVVSPAVLSVSGVVAMNKTYDGTTAATIDAGHAVLAGLAAGDSVAIDASHVVASFDGAGVGVNRPVAITGLMLTGPDASNYVLSNAATTALASITPKALTVSGITANGKVYDGTTAAAIDASGASLTGVVAGDSVALAGHDAVGFFSSKSAGVNKTVVIAGLSLSGSDASNYTIGTPTATATIAPKALAVAGITAQDKVYDGATAATLDTTGASLTGVIAGDSVGIDDSASIGSFADKNVGGAKTVVIDGLVLTGADAGNYVPVSTSATSASITPKALTVSGITASDKVYDGTTAAMFDASAASLNGMVAGDVVTIDASGVSAAFADKNVGNGKAVTVAGLALNGVAASNYTITAPSITASITPRALGVTGVTAYSKVYNGTTNATYFTNMPHVTGAVGGDSVTLTGLGAASFADKNVGNGKAITFATPSIGGLDAGNYTFHPTITGNITPAEITVSGITASNKVYDGTTDADLDLGGVSYTGVVVGDDVTIDDSSAVGRFDDKNVGAGKAVSIDGLTKVGADAGNYIFQFSPGVTADVTPKTVHANGFTATNRAYNGAVGVAVGAGTISLDASDVVVGDQVSFDASTAGSGVGVMADANAGAGKTVTITGLGLTGADAGNYTIVASTTVDIARATLTLSGVTASKVYDGTTAATLDTDGASLSGVIGSDDVMLDASTATGSFADKNVGAGKALTVAGFNLSGADAANYTLAVSPLMGSIESRVLHIDGFTATDRTYDGTSAVSVEADGIGFEMGDLVVGDDVSLDASSLSSIVGAMANKNAGSNKTVTITGLAITGADAGNYTIVATTLVNISKATLTVTGIPNLTKNYDGNQYFVSINTSGASLNGIIGGDSVMLNTSGVFGVSTSANVGTWNVFINGLALGGMDAGNYNFGTVIVSGTIVGP
ncbi:beta strand repeat-containing protein [Paludisphaera rhizosphaerae]|uniref:beta strand repeat-containing protein n=1 Tax=Paludisphaera rhizosphaerae TaxID=2711216 RepID=UPI0013EE0263|nr:YDG domain-containing protein [Paludisphaera rhizosphaerae]